mmetsp:Transcript_12528/g.43506  ORF Transcript_12528/g.43506 Transcript_12528/m.43506 type:complete len:273 (+) Transcript_12528:121-939(+)
MYTRPRHSCTSYTALSSLRFSAVLRYSDAGGSGYSSTPGSAPALGCTPPLTSSDAHLRSVCSAMSRRSRPDMPPVASAIRASSLGRRCLAYAPAISALTRLSGRPKCSVVSKRLCSAASRSCGLLVAPMTIVRPRLSRPSMRRSSTESMRLVASCISPLLAVANASISSRKSRQPLSESHSVNTSLSFFSLSPNHLEKSVSRGTYTIGTEALRAIARAVDVLPVPGGPVNSTPLARLVLCWSWRVPRATPSYTSGFCSASRSVSSISRFCSS